jgi:Flp pilus assembly pilin Flp
MKLPLRRGGSTPHKVVSRYLRKRGATAVEYLLILAAVVIPLALLLPVFMTMARIYGDRVTALIGLPYP